MEPLNNQGKAIPFITLERKGKGKNPQTYHIPVLITLSLEIKTNVQPEAIKFLRSIKTEISVVSIAGPYRCGKSYLLNHFIGQPGGFNVGHEINAATQGLWIWDKPIPVKK